MQLNLTTKDNNRFIYRITTIDRLKQLFNENKKSLVKPELWDDPFENFILKSPVSLKSNEVVEYILHESIYGQCWTFHKASDAIWRIYAPNKKGVRIRSKVSTMKEQFEKAHPENTDARCCVGKVRYLSSSRMKKVANSTFDDYGIGVDNLFGSLLIKRPAFSHEKEFRLLYFEIDDTKSKTQIYEYPVDPHQMIDQIMLDPRFSLKEAQLLEADIRSSTGFEGKILRSLLYAAPRRKILGVSDWEP